MNDTKNNPPPNGTVDSDTERLREGIEQTRAGMSATIEKLETRLPDELKGRVGAELQHVEAKVREVVKEHLAEAKTIVKEELAEAKTILRAEMEEAETKIKKGLVEARDTVKKDIEEAFTTAKRSVRAATLGKVETLATDIGDVMNDTRDTLVDTIRQNPLPAALAGLGVAWLLMNRSKSSRSNGKGRSSSFDAYGYEASAPYNGARGTRDHAGSGASHALDGVTSAVRGGVRRASEAADHLVHDASGALSQASETANAALHDASDFVGRVAHQTAGAASSLAHGAADVSSQLAHRAGDAATEVAHGARTQARRVEQSLEQTLHENPMALAAAALAVGAAVGFALPRTHAEDELMGQARDQVIKQAGTAAHDAVAAVGQFGEKAAETAKQMLGDGKQASR